MNHLKKLVSNLNEIYMNYCNSNKATVWPAKPEKQESVAGAPIILVVLQNMFDQIDDNPFADSFSFCATGSRHTCIPPVLDTDEDWICNVSPSLKGFDRSGMVVTALLNDGFDTTEEQGDYDDCMSYRKGDVNIIVIYKLELYSKWVKATEVCKYLNLQKKEERKMVHRIICGC